jgi:hypothetical protein
MIPGLFVFHPMTDTRARQAAVQTLEAPDSADMAPVDLEGSTHRLESFPELIQALGAANDSVRLELAHEINDVLVAMRQPGHEAEESEFVMQALGSKVLHPLIDRAGRSCRKEAVETMMACGFPHALFLEPEDITFALEYEPPVQAVAPATGPTLADWELEAQPSRRIGGSIIALSQLATARMLELAGASSWQLWLPMLVVFAVGFWMSWQLAMVRPRAVNIAVVGTAGFLTFLASLIVAVVANQPLAAISAAGIGVGLFVALTNAAETVEPQAGDWDDTR